MPTNTEPLPQRHKSRGKVALVTGSTSGIGLGIATALAGVGMNVMLNGFGNAGEIEKTRNTLAEDFGVETGYSAADLSSPRQVSEMVDETVRAFGQVDVLVNNAGILHVAPIEAASTDKWNAMIAINLSSAFHAIRAVLPDMKSRCWGRIVSTSSALGLVGAAGNSAYTASKHGTIGLTRSVALEVAEHGTTVNAVCPGYVLTPLVETELASSAKARGITAEQAAREALALVQPTRRFITTSEIGALVAFLCTDAGAAITGAAIPIDGGWTAQ